MAERKRITLIFQYNDNWIGGTYYVLNIIKALKNLEDFHQPHLIILYDNDSSLKQVELIGYPYISFKKHQLKLSFLKKSINKMFYYLNGKSIFKLKLPKFIGQNVYPLTAQMSNQNIVNGYYWIADLQELYLPHFFPKLEIRARLEIYKSFIKNKKPIVFSSRTAKDDFDCLKPKNKNKKVILNFASFIGSDYKKLSIAELKKKFSINMPYFIVSNQFWRHKNHAIVLEAISHLKDKKLKFQIIFTGKENDYRNPDYFPTLETYIKENNLQQYVLFLGFIDRDEQLQLMANAISIIQPSLFEGWSTVVEDAKALNQHIVLSNIPLHKEQINKNCCFFDPNDSIVLSHILSDLLENKPIIIESDYNEVQNDFGLNFLNLF